SYALGATLWEITTMRRLFKRDNDIDTIKAIEKGEIPDPRNFIQDYPAALWKIVERALWRDREGRYATALAMAEDLDMFLGSKSDHELQAQAAQLVARLFPGEAQKQNDWLVDVVGIGDGNRSSFVPPVPVAEVPAREKSIPDTGELEAIARAATEPAPPKEEEKPHAPPPSIRPIPSKPPAARVSDPPPAPKKKKKSNAARDFFVFLIAGVGVGLAIVLALNAMGK